ncbi:expressed unknown protein [Seminavis robusta]|uniref:Uncharacterized protein n=1 Tax=Seminavis robusta TaxID=568900 RepID=A0A9N8DKB8_9STRA|nr:expressed unknown protein [Seminavis robusta]|eukprot:Sro133_g062890.1 n/a (412) ;mRNA; f:15995-17230
MIIRFDFAKGEKLLVDGDAGEHPIFESPLIKDIIDCHQENGNGGPVIVELPSFIDHSSMNEYCLFLINLHQGGDEEMEFGKYYELTYQTVYQDHRHYWRWASSQSKPSPKMQAFLDWVEFYRGGCKPESPKLLLPIAKYFQMDMCARCGVMDSLSADQLEKGFQPCCRTKWPRTPVVPDWDTVTKSSGNKQKVWREAWDQADKERKETGRVVCGSDDILCKDCVFQEGCQRCRQYECEDCKQDTDTPKVFQEWHDGFPNADYEDEYGRRSDCEYRAINKSRCLRHYCRRRICDGCSVECQECHRKACDSCKEDLNTWCEQCRITIENNDDVAIGPIDRTEYVCRECFDRRPHFCGCGNPSYDPNAVAEDDEEDEDNSGSEEEPEEYYDILAPEDYPQHDYDSEGAVPHDWY